MKAHNPNPGIKPGAPGAGAHPGAGTQGPKVEWQWWAIKNLTPHDVTVYYPDGSTRTFPRTGKVARVKMYAEKIGDVLGIPVVRVRYGEIEGLPEQPDGSLYIVSLVVFRAAYEQDHPLLPYLLVPDTGPESAVRDPEGRILGVRRFIAHGTIRLDKLPKVELSHQ